MSKKILIMIIFLLGISVQSQEYFPFPTSQAIWNHNVINWQYSPYIYVSYKYRYGIIGDTIINSKQYSKVYNLNGIELDTNDGQFVGAIREEDKKIYAMYLWSFYPDNEFLIYDFNLQVGDVFVNPIYGNINIISIETIEMLDGSNRKKYSLNDGDVWIEGMGSINGLFHSIQPGLLNYTSNRLKCFHYNNVDVYIDDYLTSLTCEECFCYLSVNDYLLNDIEIFPNPFIDEINIKSTSSTNFDIIIYNSKGQVVKELYEIKTNSTINITNLSSGLYFMNLSNDKGTAYKKILKN